MAVTIIRIKKAITDAVEAVAQLIAPSPPEVLKEEPTPLPPQGHAWPFPTSAHVDHKPHVGDMYCDGGPTCPTATAAPAAGPLPWEDEPPTTPKQTVMEALELVGKNGKTLYLVHKKSGDQYKVLSWKEGRAEMEGPLHMKLHPNVTERENDKYDVVWR